MRWFILVSFLLLNSCANTFKDEITFKGKVFLGHYTYDENLGKIIVIDGPAQGAIVKEKSHPEKTTTDANGLYSLTIKTYRSFTSPKADIYTIQVFASRDSTDASDEYTTVYASPGDEVEVRPLVLVEITNEEKNF
ncbi:MAG: hypothetical protein DRI36_04125 [Caldiserica bacterium]|nr:MAG: hypothetical protein DRI36_04125 [Caldisericota bacterium]